jgi:hypothetical protein
MAVHPLAAADAEWVRATLARANELAGGALSLPALDAMWADGLARGHDANDLINLVGVAIGQHLVDAVGLEWCAVVDEYGNDLGVHGGPADAVVCPTSLVAKRWESRETDWITATVTAMVADLRAF